MAGRAVRRRASRWHLLVVCGGWSAPRPGETLVPNYVAGKQAQIGSKTAKVGWAVGWYTTVHGRSAYAAPVASRCVTAVFFELHAEHRARNPATSPHWPPPTLLAQLEHFFWRRNPPRRIYICLREDRISIRVPIRGAVTLHHAPRKYARAGLPGADSLRTWRFSGHFHLQPEGLPQGPGPYRQSPHGLVSAGVVLPHGNHEYVMMWV